MKKVLKWVGIAFVSLIVIGLIIDAIKSPEQKAAEVAAREQQQAKQDEDKRENARQEMATMPAITANDIVSAYGENTVAADQQFKDKKFKISGIVSDINTDLMGDPYITLSGGGNQFMEPHFGFDKSEAAQLANLKKGAMVTLVCIGKGDVAKTPMSDSCLLVDDGDVAANKMVTTPPPSPVAVEQVALVTTRPIIASEQTALCQELDLSVTPDQIECFDREFADADKQLNATYKQLMPKLDDSRKSLLKKEQIAWIKEKEAKCAQAGKEFEGGQMEVVAIADCTVQMTKQRLIYLNNYK